ncbi:Uncharacterised protein [Chromobacterium vaccinii]|nr:Uncharacterised protein [Chromobacterium vaccinii]
MRFLTASPTGKPFEWVTRSVAGGIDCEEPLTKPLILRCASSRLIAHHLYCRLRRILSQVLYEVLLAARGFTREVSLKMSLSGHRRSGGVTGNGQIGRRNVERSLFSFDSGLSFKPARGVMAAVAARSDLGRDASLHTSVPHGGRLVRDMGQGAVGPVESIDSTLQGRSEISFRISCHAPKTLIIFSCPFFHDSQTARKR